jgi:hypothetical protein
MISLTNLFLEGISIPIGGFFTAILRALRNLQTLNIAGCPSLIPDAFFERLETTTEDSSQTVVPYLPSLRVFTYVGTRSFSWTAFQRMLCRMEGPSSQNVIVSSKPTISFFFTDEDSNTSFPNVTYIFGAN